MYGGGAKRGEGGDDESMPLTAESQGRQVIDGTPSQSQPERYKFSPEEIRVLRECNRESFYYRSLPLGTFLGVGAYYAVRAGYLKPSARWGAGPKMFVGSIIGYFLGKMSYQSACVEKLMKLPNSPLAEMLRKQKGKAGFQEAINMEPGFVSAVGLQGFSDADMNQGAKDPASFTDVNDTRPMNNFDTESSTGMDFGKYDTTNEMLDDDNLPQRRSQQYSTSYDELRKMNRDEFDHKVPSPTTSPPRPVMQTPTQQSNSPYQYPPAREGSAGQASKVKKNIYGDVWDDKQQ